MTRFRRRRHLVLRVADEPVLEVAELLGGRVGLHMVTQCSLLCPLRGCSMPLTPEELRALMAVPADRWTSDDAYGPGAAVLDDLARRGILLSDPAAEGWADLAEGEEALTAAQWHSLAAVYHAHTTWESVDGSLADLRRTTDTSLVVEASPSVRRVDAIGHVTLRLPVLQGPFFEVVRARRTTRSFRSQEPLPRLALETVLYAVFGTHGTKLQDGVTGVKRTSPSGGALHPIEAYILAVHVEALVPGLYHYETGTHRLACLETLDADAARRLAVTFTAGQSYFAEAHVLVIHVARFDRSFAKYASHRKAYKSVLMDSAHLSQTLYLTATHLDLGAFYTAAINDVDIGRRLRLPFGREGAVAISGLGLPSELDPELHFMPDRYTPDSSAV